jgi:hypothetical protein
MFEIVPNTHNCSADARGFIDDVIRPHDTRKRMRKHGNIPL